MNHPYKERAAALKTNRGFRALLASIESDGSSSVHDDAACEVALSLLEDTAALITTDDAGGDTSLTGDCEELDASNNAFDAPAEEYHAFLTTIIAMHFISASTPDPSKYKATAFSGILIDTGCPNSSAGEKAQFDAYCNFERKSPIIDATKHSTIRFGKGSSRSIGTALCSFPLGHLVLQFKMHVLPDTDLAILLSLRDMDELGVYFNNLTNTVRHPASGATAMVTGEYGHPFLQWSNISICMFT